MTVLQNYAIILWKLYTFTDASSPFFSPHRWLHQRTGQRRRWWDLLWPGKEFPKVLQDLQIKTKKLRFCGRPIITISKAIVKYSFSHRSRTFHINVQKHGANKYLNIKLREKSCWQTLVRVITDMLTHQGFALD